MVAACAVIVVAMSAAALTTRHPAARRSSPPRRTTPSSAARTSTTTTTIARSTTSTTRAPATSTTRASTTTTAAPAPTTTAAPAPPVQGTGSLAAVAGKTIFLDPGHDGGNAAHPEIINRPVYAGPVTKTCDTAGTETPGGYSEHAYTFDVALRARALLTAAGAHVVMARSTDSGVGPCIDVRAAIGNDAHAAVGVAIHADGGPTGGRGFCVYMPASVRGWTDDIYSASQRLGVAMRDAYGAASGVPAANYVCSGGLATSSSYARLNLSNIPTVLFETANARNSTDAAAMESSSGRQRIAAGIAAGIARFLAG